MKYVTKFLCALATTAFLTSCASTGSGCYDFSDSSKLETNAISEDIVVVAVSKKQDFQSDVLTICED